MYEPLFGQLTAQRSRETKIDRTQKSKVTQSKFSYVSPFLAGIQGRSHSLFGVAGQTEQLKLSFPAEASERNSAGIQSSPIYFFKI